MPPIIAPEGPPAVSGVEEGVAEMVAVVADAVLVGRTVREARAVDWLVALALVLLPLPAAEVRRGGAAVEVA